MRFQIEEKNSFQYPSHLRLCHEIKFSNNYLWLYMYGTADTSRILRIDPTDLSNYTEITISGAGKTLPNMMLAKGYLWFPYEYYSMKFVRLDPVSLDYRIFSGPDSEVMTKPQVMTYIEEKDEIWISANEGYRICDVSGDLSLPTWEPKDFRNYFTYPDSPKLYNLHSGVYYHGSMYYFGIDRTNELLKSVGAIKIDVNNPESFISNGYYSELRKRFVTDDCALLDDVIYFGLEQVDPHIATEHIAAIDPDDLSLIDSISADGIDDRTPCYGVFALKNHILAVFASEPGIMKIYDKNLNEVCSHTFPTGFNRANEFCSIDDKNNFISFWDTNNLAIQNIEINKNIKQLLDGSDTSPLKKISVR